MSNQLTIEVYNNIASGAPPIQVIETEISSSSIFVQPQEAVAPINVQVYESTTSGTFPIQVIESEFTGVPIYIQVQEDYAPVQSVNGKIGWVTITKEDLGITGYVLSGDLSNYVTKISGQFLDRPTVNGTGVLLSGEAAQLPNTIVYTTGNQTVNGLKDFTVRPTVNTIPIALSGEAASSIEQYVKNDEGSTIYKGQPVYVNGSNGNNILVKLARNTGEPTSSKTFGLLKQDLAVNQFGYIVTEGPIYQINTSDANEGDPIWLGPTGNLIYGLVNKPKAPNHLVFLGFVERKHQNQGKIFVKIQNGFELEELHNVRIINPQNGDIIQYNSTSGLWLNSNNSFYPSNNPSGFITGVDLSNYATVANLQLTGEILQNQINNISGVNVSGDYYPNSNPSGFITGVDTSNFYTKDNPSGFITGVDTSNFYTKDNPSGFITGVDTSNFYTKDNPSGFITGVDTSNFYTKDNPSGFITGVDTSNFYTKDNPSGFITGVDIDLSSYATTGQLSQVSGNLQSQINNLDVNSIAYAIALG